MIGKKNIEEEEWEREREKDMEIMSDRKIGKGKCDQDRHWRK